MNKPWPLSVSAQGLRVDAPTEAPPVQIDITETLSQSPLTRASAIQRSVSNLGPANPEPNPAQNEQETNSATRPRFQRSYTQPQPNRDERIAVDNLLNKYRMHNMANVLSKLWTLLICRHHFMHLFRLQPMWEIISVFIRMRSLLLLHIPKSMTDLALSHRPSPTSHLFGNPV